jgi:hypothetical protein
MWGVVITEAGNDSNVAGLVYIAAFAPDKGEVGLLAHRRIPHRARQFPPILPPKDRYLFPGSRPIPASFAADVADDTAAFMADCAGAWARRGSGRNHRTQPAWRANAELVPRRDRGTDDPPDAQRAMSKRAGATVVEVKGSHSV